MASKFLTALGVRIRDARKAAGQSQEAFAREVGLDRAFYGRVERGQQNIAMITAARIAATLDLPLAELFEGVPRYSAETDEIAS